MKNKESFLIYKPFYEAIKYMADDKMGKLFKAIFEYQINGIYDTSDSEVNMAMEFFKNQFRLDHYKYLKRCKRNEENGAKGGRPRTKNLNNPMGLIVTQITHNNPEEPKKPDNDKDNDKDNVKDKNKKEREKKEVIPPTLDEFKAYCNTDLKEYDIDIDNVFQGYAVNNWHDSQGTQIKNWKMKLRQVWCKKKKTSYPQFQTSEEKPPEVDEEARRRFKEATKHLECKSLLEDDNEAHT